MDKTGTLFIVATPIGNLQDITLRALETLKTADLILAEDTRHTGQLLHHCDIKTPMLPFHEFNENQKAQGAIEKLREGLNLALVSDAGTPLVSDPGYKLVRDCIAQNIPVISIPGASAAVTALTSSGLPPDKFFFVGFLPQKPGKRHKLLETLQTTCKNPDDDTAKATIIIYESPHHLQKTLAELQEVFGDMQIVVARELTKLHEELFRGPIAEAISHFKTPKGEFVLLL